MSKRAYLEAFNVVLAGGGEKVVVLIVLNHSLPTLLVFNDMQELKKLLQGMFESPPEVPEVDKISYEEFWKKIDDLRKKDPRLEYVDFKPILDKLVISSKK